MRSWVRPIIPHEDRITEYNWGAEPTSTADRPADILGILAGKDLIWPRAGRRLIEHPHYKAMKMYRNYDGKNLPLVTRAFLWSCPTPTTCPLWRRANRRRAMTLMVINKDLNNSTPITANITNFNATGTAQRWQLTPPTSLLSLRTSPHEQGSQHVLPAQSITLYVLPAVNTSIASRSMKSTNQLPLWLNGQAGLVIFFIFTTFLTGWRQHQHAFQQFLPYLVATTNSAKMFYRGLYNRRNGNQLRKSHRQFF